MNLLMNGNLLTRNDTGFIPKLCLVAICNNEIIGYILLSKALIGKNEGLALGPLAVKPSYQCKGIGKKLIDYGLIKAKEYRFEWVALTVEIIILDLDLNQL